MNDIREVLPYSFDGVCHWVRETVHLLLAQILQILWPYPRVPILIPNPTAD